MTLGRTMGQVHEGLHMPGNEQVLLERSVEVLAINLLVSLPINLDYQFKSYCPSNISIYQCINISIHQYINISIYQIILPKCNYY